MSQEQLLSGLKKDVRSLLISAKSGLTPEHLKRDYMNMLGHPLPLRFLGFRSVLDMVRDMPDVVWMDYAEDGSIVLKAVADDSTKAINDLVARQRKPKQNNRKPIRRAGIGTFFSRHYSPLILPRRGHAPPSLPAQLRSQLRQLLSVGPVRLSELETGFAARFGRPLQVTHYGFYSIAEMLTVAADLIAVQQSRSGSLLTLRSVTMPVEQTPSLAAALTKQKLSGTAARLSADSVPKEIPVPTHCKESITEIPKEVVPNSTAEAVCTTPELVPTQQGPSFKKSVTKLEQELRQRILESGDTATVSPELKAKLRQLVVENPKGISVHNLPVEYKRVFGEDLPVAQCGFLTVTEMVGALSDTLYLQPGSEEGSNHWIVIDIQHSDAQPGTSQNEDPSASKSPESLDPSNKGYYLSCGESHWEGEGESEESSNDLESDTKLRIATKTFHQMVDVFPVTVPCRDSMVPPDAVLCHRLKAPSRRQERELVPVLVERVESPSHFYIRFDENQEARMLENMMIEMRSCYTCPEVAGRYRLPDGYVRPGQVCCVAPRDMWFYRVVIHRVLGPSEVEVYYVDFGDLTNADRSSLRFLKSCYAELPAQAVPSSLTGVRPIRGTWTPSASTYFQKLCCERTLVAAIHSYQEDFLQLFLCDTHTEEDVYAHTALTAAGHALPCALAATGLVSGQFNPVTLYLGEGLLDEVPEVEPVMETSPDPANGRSPDVPAQASSTSNQTLPVSDGGNKEHSAKEEESLPADLPELEFINVVEVHAGAKGERANPFGALLCKDAVNCSDWDQGWTPDSAADKTNSKPQSGSRESRPASVPPSPPPPSVSESVPQPFCDYVGEAPRVVPQPSTLHTLSLHTPGLTQTQSCGTGVTSEAFHPPSPGIMFPLFGLGERLNPDKLFLRHASPFALSPSARLAAGASLLNWYPHKLL